MKYGKIYKDKVYVVIETDDSEIGYSGSMFYNKDGTYKKADEIIIEQNLKRIDLPANLPRSIEDYKFTEYSNYISVKTTLTTEGEAKVEKETKAKRKFVIEARLKALSEDIIQIAAGEYIPDASQRKAEFISLHNELRALQGKPPRNTL